MASSEVLVLATTMTCPEARNASGTAPKSGGERANKRRRPVTLGIAIWPSSASKCPSKQRVRMQDRGGMVMSNGSGQLSRLDVVIGNNFGHLPMFVGAEKGIFEKPGIEAHMK